MMLECCICISLASTSISGANAPGAGGDESPRKILPLFDENRIRGFGKQIIRGETKILHVSEQFFFLTLFLD